MEWEAEGSVPLEEEKNSSTTKYRIVKTATFLVIMIAMRSISSSLHMRRSVSSVLLELQNTMSSPYSSRAYLPPHARGRTQRLRRSNSKNHNPGTEEKEEVRAPSLKMAKAMALSYREMENSSLVALGAMGENQACREMLIRHIMAVDEVSYDLACWKFLEIEEKNHKNMYLLALPFQIGVFSCLGAALISIPLVFHLPTVEYVNLHYVTAEHPPLKELETVLEVGGWSWAWMEPCLGVCTFVLLCLQYMR
jgi:hypothetical protein